MQTLALIERLRSEHGPTVLAVLHHLNHALATAQHVIVIDVGRVVASGPPDTVITPRLLRTCSASTRTSGTHTDAGVRYVVPLGPAPA